MNRANPFVLDDRVAAGLACAAVFLTGASLPLPVSRRVPPRRAEYAARAVGGSTPSVRLPSPTRIPDRLPAPGAQAPSGSLADFFDGSLGGETAERFAREFAQDPARARALESLKRTGNAAAFVEALRRDGSFASLLHRRAADPGFDRFAARLANEPTLAPLARKAGRERTAR